MSKSKKKVTIIICGILILLIGAVMGEMLFCAVYKKIKWEPLVETSSDLNYTYNGYVVDAFYVDDPFSIRGNVSITQPTILEIDPDTGETEQLNDKVELMAFPKLFGGCKVIVQISEQGGTGYSFCLDENMEFTDSSGNSADQEYFEKYRQTIEEEYEILHEVYGL